MEQKITFCISLFFFLVATVAAQGCQAVNETCGNGGTCGYECTNSTTESPTTTTAAETTTTTTTTTTSTTTPPPPAPPVRKRRAVSNGEQCELTCLNSGTSKKEPLWIQMSLVGLLVGLFLIH